MVNSPGAPSIMYPSTSTIFLTSVSYRRLFVARNVLICRLKRSYCSRRLNGSGRRPSSFGSAAGGAAPAIPDIGAGGGVGGANGSNARGDATGCCDDGLGQAAPELGLLAAGSVGILSAIEVRIFLLRKPDR